MAKKVASKIDVISYYLEAQQVVTSSGYGWEIDWQRSRDIQRVTESDFLREAAWVILCSGFRESAVRRCFDYLSLCFCDWDSAMEISNNREICIETATGRFRNRRKLKAIADAAQMVAEVGFEEVKDWLADDPIETLQQFPYIGPVTSWHLAKNLGVPVAKNDRHLARMAQEFGCSDGIVLCQMIADATSEAVQVVDVILWRYAILTSSRRAEQLRLN